MKDDRKFSRWQELQTDEKAVDDVHSLIMLVRLTRFYAKVLGESKIIQGSLKKDISFIHSSCNSFINRFRSGIKKDELDAFDKNNLDSDFYAWGQIIRGINYLNDDEAEAVERFVLGIACGVIDAKVENGTELIINNDKL